MKKTVILILIIFSIINCQSDDAKLNIDNDKTPNNDTILKTFTLKLDKNYFLVNKEIKFKINYELENKQDNKNLVLRLKSIGKDALKHQINGVDFVFGKNDVKEKQEFFDNTDGHLYLTSKRTGYLDLEFSGQLYDTVKKQYVGKPIISKISLVSLKLELSLSNSTSHTSINVKFDDGIYETDNFLSTENKTIQGFDLTVIIDNNELKTTKNINPYKTTKIFENKTSNTPKKVDVILKQKLTNGDINTFKFNDLEFKPKEVTLKRFDLKLDKNYTFINREIKIKVNYEVANGEINNDLVLKIKPVHKDVTKKQFSGFKFINSNLYLTPIKTGSLNLEFIGELYDDVKKEYVGKPFISKIKFICKDVFDGLKPIHFEKKADKVISEEKTDKKISDGNGGFKYLYKRKILKSYLIYPIKTLFRSIHDVIYPGSILMGDSFLRRKYKQATFKESYNPVTMSMSINLIGNSKIESKVIPTLDGVRDFFIKKLPKNINFASSTDVFKFESFKITSLEELKRSSNSYLSNRALNYWINSSFDYKEGSKKSYTLVSIKQTLFNFSMEAQHHSKWLKNGFSENDFLGTEPIYISNVCYGRMAYILIESSEAKGEVEKMVNNAVLFRLFDYKEDKYKKDYLKFNSVFKDGRVKVYTLGGSLSLPVKDIKSFFKFLNLSNSKKSINYSMPISFKLRKVSDNTEVKVFDTYIDMIELYK